MEGLTERCNIPTGNIHGVEMQNGRQRIEFVKAWHYTTILDVCQAADVEDEVWTAPIDGNLITGFLDITISEAESLACLA